MATNQISVLDNHHLDVGSESNEEDDDDDDDEETYPNIASRTEIGVANLKQCAQTHIGHRSDYYGPVKVRTVYKVIAPQPFTPTLPHNGPYSPISLARPFDYSTIGPSSSSDAFTPALQSGSQASAEHQDNLSHFSINNDDPNSITTNDTNDQTALLGGSNKYNFKQILCFGAVIFGILAMTIVLIIEIILYYQINPLPNDDLPMNFTERLVTRGEWFAFLPKHDLTPFKLKPIPYIVVAHTATSACYNQELCKVKIRNFQADQMKQNYIDIAYNYLVGGDGYIYEGRGWNYTSGVNYKVNCSALFVAFIGNFLVRPPPVKQMDAFKIILDKAESAGILEKNYKMFMHKQVSVTESPGAALINILVKWPHWKPFGKDELLCDKNDTEH